MGLKPDQPASAERRTVQVAIGALHTPTPATIAPTATPATTGATDTIDTTDTAGPVRVLITRRPADNPLYAGYWELPGGKREPGESLADCLKREFLEELGIHVRVGHLLIRLTHAYEHATVDLSAFLCTHLAGQPQPRQVAEFRWVQPGDLGQYRFLPANGPILDAIRGTLGRGK